MVTMMDLDQYNVPGSRLTVTDVEQLGAIELLTHDEYFEYGDIVYDSRRRQLRIPFRRIFHGNPGTEVMKRQLDAVSEVPVLRCCVVVEDVEELALSSWQGICSFTGWQYDACFRQLSIAFWMGLSAVMTVSGLSVIYEAIEFRGKGRIARGLFGAESTDGKVYEKCPTSIVL
jgi:hypothetical protein